MNFVAKILFLLSLPMPDLNDLYHPVEEMFRELLGAENMTKLNSSKNAAILLRDSVYFSYFTSSEKCYDHPYKNSGFLVRFNAALSIPGRNNSGPALFIPVVLDEGKFGCITLHSTRTLGTILR